MKIYFLEVKSVYTSTTNNRQKNYYLHPGFVDINNDGDEETTLCNPCFNNIEKKLIPSLSIANGVDFGNYNIINLTKPNVFEKTILSKVRLYYKIIKIQSNSNGRNDYTHSKLRSHL